MNRALKRVLTCTPLFRRVYNEARRHYRTREALRSARGYFVNYADYRKVLLNRYPGNSLELHATNGLKIAIRPTRSDAMLLYEVLVTRSYARYLPSGAYRTVVDIGGYIGDFALFAVADLKASKVITCEPSPDNCALARMNIGGNQLHDRVSLVEKAVTKDGAPLMLDVDSEAQYRVSAYGTARTARIPIPSTTLPDMIADFNLTDIDLLKVDCEGGEYDIFESLPDHYFAGIHNIVFEFHSIEGYGPRLTVVKERLRHHGYALRNSGDLIWATRP